MRKSEIEAIVKMLNALDQEEDEIKKEEEAPYIKEPTKYLEESENGRNPMKMPQHSAWVIL